MQILENTELDFSDVLIKPRRSTILSRKDVDITREYKFKWCPYVIKGTGIMNANMGTIGVFKLCDKMLDAGLFACLHKFHDADSLADYYSTLVKDPNRFKRCFLAIGIRNWDDELKKIDKIIETTGITPSIRLDVPNGYIPTVKECVIELREKYPDILIGVGNVVTGDICEDLILSGADFCLIGIGPGQQCFVGNTLVNTKDGKKKIRDINEGDEVLTHTGEYHKVVTKLCYNDKMEKITINGIECTPDHKFLVINKSHKQLIDDSNYMDYAYWVEAEKLNEEYQLLLKIK